MLAPVDDGPAEEGSKDDVEMLASASMEATHLSRRTHHRHRRRRQDNSPTLTSDSEDEEEIDVAKVPYLQLNFDSISSVVWHRTSLLVSLLLLQSLSQFILEMYEGLISKHVIIPLFLTMLVGAGGNAGNQSTVRAITGLISKEFKPKHFIYVLRKEIICGVINALILAGICFSRVYYFYGHHDLFWSTLAITFSLFAIVLTSAILGCTLPFLIGAFGFDREHAAPIIQVTMDIIGVFITCVTCTLLIPESEHKTHEQIHGTAAPR